MKRNLTGLGLTVMHGKRKVLLIGVLAVVFTQTYFEFTNSPVLSPLLMEIFSTPGHAKEDDIPLKTGFSAIDTEAGQLAEKLKEIPVDIYTERVEFLLDIQTKMNSIVQKYVDMCTELVYGHFGTKQLTSPLDKMKFFYPVLSHPHNLKCNDHEPGLLQIFGKKKRRYCYGGTTLTGKRVCDRHDPLYIPTTPPKPIMTELYGHSFVANPFTLKSDATIECENNPRACESYITISTQGTSNRYNSLINLAHSWRGPISFALLVNDENEKYGAIEICLNTPMCKKYVDLHVAVRTGHGASHTAHFYPINYLRNLAVQNVKTGLLYQIDVDNIPNDTHEQYVQWMKSALQSPNLAASDSITDCPGLHAFVPPAFEMSAEELNLIIFSGEPPRILKSTIVSAILEGIASPMHGYYPPAYGPTEHYSWLRSTNVTRLHYVTRFEPYYIARVPVPLFNETFVNRGGNFAQQVYEMSAAGYTFWRLPEAFIIDIAHSKGCAHNKNIGSEQYTGEDDGDVEVGSDIDLDEDEGPSTIQDDVAAEKESKDLTASGKVGFEKTSDRPAVFANQSGQLTLSSSAVISMWLNFWEHVCHRYGIHMPNPDSKEINFVPYRAHIVKLWSHAKERLGKPT